MQGINNREHRNLLDVFHKYEYMSAIAGNLPVLEVDGKIQHDMEELAVLYTRFKLLLAELEKCTRDYELKKKSTRSVLHKRIRMLTTKMQKENMLLR